MYPVSKVYQSEIEFPHTSIALDIRPSQTCFKLTNICKKNKNNYNKA